MRVLHCIYDDPANPWVAGGGAVRVREIYRRLSAQLDGVTVLTGSYPGAADEEIEGIRYVRSGARSPYWWSRASYSLIASKRLHRNDFDVAIVDFSTYAPILVPRDRPVGLTVHHVTGSSASDRWGSALGRLVRRQELSRLRAGRMLSATSQATKSRLEAILDPAAEIRVIQAGVPDELFGLSRREADYLLYFGRLDWYQKGLDILLDAIRIAAREYPSIRVIFAGRGKDAERVVEASYSLGIRDNVQMIGPVGDMERNELLSGARALLMPSRFEGFGMVAAEAMAAGVPLIASDAGSLPEVVDPPRGGITVPSENPEALAGAILGLLRDPAARRDLSRTARISAERFRWDVIAAKHLEFLNALQNKTTWQT